MDPNQLLPLIFDNKPEKTNYSQIKLKDLKKTSDLLFIIIKPIFFYGDSQFKLKGIKQKIKSHEWLNSYIGSFLVSLQDTSDETLTYDIIIKYFCDYYDKIKAEFNDFIKGIEKLRTQLDFDLFEVAICFMCYLNKNNKYLDTILELKKESLIKNLEKYEDTLTKNYLYYTITDYCILYNIPIIKDEEYDTQDINKKKIITEVKELQIYADLCPMKERYKEFLLSICSCLKDCEDLRNNQEKNVVNYIELIFIMLNIHLKKKNYWEENQLSLAINDIYKCSFQFCTENFDENYIDFVISYITKYEISSEDFVHFFLRGLDKNQFNKVFANLHLKDNINNYKKETMKNLINKIYKKKKNGTHSLNGDKQESTNQSNNYSKESIPEASKGFNQEQKNEIQSDKLINSNHKENNTVDNKENNTAEKKEIKEINNIINQNNIIVEKKNKDKKVSINNNETNKEKIDKINSNAHLSTQSSQMLFQINNKDISKEKIKEDDNHKTKIDKKGEVIPEDNNSLIKKLEERLLNLEKENKTIKDEYILLKTENNNREKEYKLLKEENNKREKEYELLKDENDKREKEYKLLKKENNNMKEAIQDMNAEINTLQKKNNKKDIEMKQLKDEFKLLNKDIERISFRDLSKRVLNKMIAFVNSKNEKFLYGLTKRKEKLNKINDKFDFEGIIFMKKPFKEICDRYYNSNSRSHVPDIAENLKNKPFGLTFDPEGIILKKYYEIMIDSKNEEVFNFLSKDLNLKEEIKHLYL